MANLKELATKSGLVEGGYGVGRYLYFGSFVHNGYTYYLSNTSLHPDGIKLNGTILSWDEFEKNETAHWSVGSIGRYMAKHVINMEAERVGGKFVFKDNDKNESLIVDTVNQAFIKQYANGKTREIVNPRPFFAKKPEYIILGRMKNGGNFPKLLELVKKNSNYTNLGSILVESFDKLHLESYIAANVKFDYRATHPYNFFPKDAREKLAKEGISFDKWICDFFSSDMDKAKSVFSLIKDKPNFVTYFKVLSTSMTAYTLLSRHYGYDVKRVFEYCEERGFTNRVATTPLSAIPNSNYISTYTYNLIGYLKDYADMATFVYGEGRFPKYPANITEAHDEVNKIYQSRKQEYDEMRFKDIVDTSLERNRKGEKFIIKCPETSAEVINEGQVLRHCVGGYISSILNGTCQIVFLRKAEEPNTPYVTVEVRGGRVTQASGVSNSRPEMEAAAFLRTWKKSKKLD